MMLDALGYPPKKSYLFLGDYVDRGTHGLQIVLLIFSFALLYPNHVRILKGNHELRHVNICYGFRQECLAHMSEYVYERINQIFDSLPIAAVVDNSVFCCHGGLGPTLHSL